MSEAFKDDKTHERELWLILLGMCLQSTTERREYAFKVLPNYSCQHDDISGALVAIQNKEGKESIARRLARWVGCGDIPETGSLEMVVEKLRRFKTKRTIIQFRNVLNHKMSEVATGDEVKELFAEAMSEIEECERFALPRVEDKNIRKRQDHVNKISGCVDEETKNAYTSLTTPPPNSGGDSGDVPGVSQRVDQGAAGVE